MVFQKGVSVAEQKKPSWFFEGRKGIEGVNLSG